MYTIIASIFVGGLVGYFIKYRYFKVPYFGVWSHVVWGLVWGVNAGIVILLALSLAFTNDLQVKSEISYELEEISNSTYINIASEQVKFIRRVDDSTATIESVSLTRSKFSNNNTSPGKAKVQVTSYEAIPNNWLVSWDKANKYTFVVPKGSKAFHDNYLK